MTVEQRIGEAQEQFPIGMRVLAVDDDPTCLLLLETLLRRCQYHVTATSQAITALKMLRENKNKFDLVISDVHMPDMDGFKLLELVGLEMDLPVIMLSANSDPKLVMKGITHGACDYLLKPIRVEELKNIWQHVVRRKFDNRDRNNSDNGDKPSHGSGESPTEQKNNKRRKDQNEDEDEDRDDNGHENEDPATQKKPRVVWSVDLHRKFVAAVNQLGIDKAVPKKILDLMNVEKLTRENVASHLQKYRLYLKRISTVANQQASMVAALSSSDASYLQTSSLSGITFHNMAGTGQFHNGSFRSLTPSGMLGRLNSPAGLGMRGLPSSGAIQLGHVQTTGNSINSRNHFQTGIHPGNNGNILQGMPMPLEFDQMQSNKGVPYVTELPTGIDNSSVFPANDFSDAKTMGSSSSNPFLATSNKQLMVETHRQRTQDGQNFGGQTSLLMSTLDSGFSPHFPGQGRCHDSWSSAFQSTGVESNSFTLSDCFKQATQHSTNTRDSTSSMALQSGRNPCNISTISTLPIQLQDTKPDLRCQDASCSAGQMINNAPQGWVDHRQDPAYHSNAVCSSINSTIHVDGIESPMGQSLNANNTVYDRTTSFSSTGPSNFVDSSLIKQNDFENNFGYLEDVASIMAKRDITRSLIGLSDNHAGSGQGEINRRRLRLWSLFSEDMHIE